MKQVGAEERKQTEEQLKIKSKLDKNAEIINAIILSISDGVDTKKELLERACETPCELWGGLRFEDAILIDYQADQ